MFEPDQLDVAMDLLKALRDCAELNHDSLEPETVELLSRVNEFLGISGADNPAP